jgi:hypothetical protein
MIPNPIASDDEIAQTPSFDFLMNGQFDKRTRYPKRMRPRKRQISNIVVSNCGKKLIQLNRRACDLEYEAANLRFRAGFLRDYFEPRISTAIQRFRDHIAKMQQTALDDYVFVCDRTERFYARKYASLKREIPSFIDAATHHHDEKAKELSNLIIEANKTKQFLITQVHAKDQELAELFRTFNPSLKQQVRLAHAQGKKLIDDFLASARAQDARFIAEHESHCAELREEHKRTLAQLRQAAAGRPVALPWLQPMADALAKLKADIASAKKRLPPIASDFLKQMKSARQKADELKAGLQEANALASTEQQNKDELHKHEMIIGQLNDDITAIQLQNTKEVNEKQEELRKLMREHENIERRRREILDNELSVNDSDFERLVVSLRAEREEVELSLQEQSDAKSQSILSLQAELRQCAELGITESQRSLNSSQELESLRTEQENALLSESQQMQSVLHAREEEIMLAKQSQAQDIPNLQRELADLNVMRQEFAESAEVEVAAFAKDSERQIEMEQKLFDSQLTLLRTHISEDFERFRVQNEQLIEDQRAANIRAVQNRRDSLVSQQNAGADDQELASEVTRVTETYKAAYRQLQTQLELEGRSVPSPNCPFQTLVSIYADLEKELSDRQSRITTERNLISYEWTNRLNE